VTARRSSGLVCLLLTAGLALGTAGAASAQVELQAPEPAAGTLELGTELGARTVPELEVLLAAECSELDTERATTCVSVSEPESTAPAPADAPQLDPVTELALEQGSVDLTADPGASVESTPAPAAPVEIPQTDGEAADPVVGNLVRTRADASELTFTAESVPIPRSADKPLREVDLPWWCSEGEDQYTRTEWCMGSTWAATVVKISARGVARVVGTAAGTLSQYVYTSTSVSHVINQTTIRQTSGTGRSALSVAGALICSGNCDYQRGDLAQRNLPLNKDVTVVGDISPTLAQRTDQTSRLNWVFTLRLRSGDSTPAEVTALTRQTRCDNRGARGVRGQGCVVNATTTYYVYQYDQRFYSVAAHIAAAHSSGLPGSHWSELPLTRTTNPATVSSNRRAACPRSVQRPDGYTCDEYPFASTLQGAASGGVVRVLPGCNLLEVPGTGPVGFSRCMVPTADASAHGSNENSAQGSNLGLFYGSQRVLDGEDFWVELTYPV